MASHRKRRRLHQRLMSLGMLVAALTAAAGATAQARPLAATTHGRAQSTAVTPTMGGSPIAQSSARLQAERVRSSANVAARPIVRTVTVSPQNGFAWRDATIGAAITLVLFGAAVAATRARRPTPVESV
jgi:hypothetical protein